MVWSGVEAIAEVTLVHLRVMLRRSGVWSPFFPLAGGCMLGRNLVIFASRRGQNLLPVHGPEPRRAKSAPIDPPG